jgi:hypothetical protein
MDGAQLLHRQKGVYACEQVLRLDHPDYLTLIFRVLAELQLNFLQIRLNPLLYVDSEERLAKRHC